MKTIENISTGEVFEGEELEFFVDDDTSIGEVYLDGDLIFQSLETMNDNQLERAFEKEFKVTSEAEDIFHDFNIYKLVYIINLIGKKIIRYNLSRHSHMLQMLQHLA